MAEFKIGDMVWVAIAHPRQVRQACPVCFGKRTVILLLGDDSRVETPCDYCGHAGESHGYTLEWDKDPAAEQDRITEIRARETSTGREVEYVLSSHCAPRAEDLFADQASALARAEEKVRQMQAADDENRRVRKDGTLRKTSWLVGYHRREAKDHRRQMEWHEARAVLVKQGAAAPAEAANAG